LNPVYSAELPSKGDLFDFYEKLGWNAFLGLCADELLEAMRGSHFSVYVYIDGVLAGTGRVVSDGVISAYICGVGVLPEFQNQGIGTEIMKRLRLQCDDQNLHVQFFCGTGLVPYYKKIGAHEFAVGMRY